MGWRELEVLLVAWFDNLARIFAKVVEVGVWPDCLLDVYVDMIPEVDGDATPLGQRPLSVLPVVYSIWASARMVQLELWFRWWVPLCVFSAGGGRSSVQTWFTTVSHVEKVLSGIIEGDVHIFVADVIKSFEIVDRGVLDRVLGSWVCLVGFGIRILSSILWFVCGLNLLGWDSLGPGMVGSLRVVLQV